MAVRSPRSWCPSTWRRLRRSGDSNAQHYLELEDLIRDAALIAETVRDIWMNTTTHQDGEHVNWAVTHLIDLTSELLRLYRQVDESEEDPE